MTMRFSESDYLNVIYINENYQDASMECDVSDQTPWIP